MDVDLGLALHLADVADAETMQRWSAGGVVAAAKQDGTPVTEADVAAEQAVLAAIREACPDDGFLGEEVGAKRGTNDRRWIVDGVDGTRFFAGGSQTWGTLIALEVAGQIVIGVSSSPAQDRRWWATRGGGAFTSSSRERKNVRRIQVAEPRPLRPDLVVTLPEFADLDARHQHLLHDLAGGAPAVGQHWSHQNRVAEGEVDLCVWLAGDIWDHAAPSIIVEEAGGRFSDHQGGRRLDTRTAIYSSGPIHDHVLDALGGVRPNRRNPPPASSVPDTGRLASIAIVDGNING